jgi:hypothetical protein
MSIFDTITEKFRMMQQRSTNNKDFHELVLMAVAG